MSNISPPTLDSHMFQEPESNASRSPCPGLNALASHGYIPRSGRDITFMQFLNALRAVYNLSIPLALSLTSGAFFLSGRNGIPTMPFIGTINLHDLARHGRIEHDGSLAHADAESHAVFAPTMPDQALLEDMIAQSRGEVMTSEDLVRVRRRRDETLIQDGRSLTGVHAELARGELAFILAIIGDGTNVSPQRLKQWMGEDRLPDGWTRPYRTLGLIETIKMARRLKVAIKREDVCGPTDQVERE